MLSNIGDISEDVHMYVLETWMDLVPGEGTPFEDAPPSPLKVEARMGGLFETIQCTVTLNRV